MKWLVMILFLISTSCYLYSSPDSVYTTKSEGYVNVFYNWDSEYNLYGLNLGVSIPTSEPKYISLLFELGGGLGKFNDNKLWGFAVKPGLRLSFNKGITSMFIDVLSGFGAYFYDGKDKGIYGNQTEYRGSFGINSFSVGFFVNAFIGNGLSFSGNGILLSWQF